MSEQDDVLVRVPPLKKHDQVVITRADHGGYIATVGVVDSADQTIGIKTQAAFSTQKDLHDWLRQVFLRWHPIVELNPPAPRTNPKSLVADVDAS